MRALRISTDVELQGRLTLSGVDALGQPNTIFTGHDAFWFIGPHLAACAGTATLVPNGAIQAGTSRWSFSGAADQFVKVAPQPSAMDSWAAYTVRIAWICPDGGPAGSAIWKYYRSETFLGGNPGVAPTLMATTAALPVPTGPLGSNFRYDDIAVAVPVGAPVLGAGGLTNGIIERNGAADVSANLCDIIGISYTRV